MYAIWLYGLNKILDDLNEFSEEEIARFQKQLSKESKS